jgi:hypothetical protein
MDAMKESRDREIPIPENLTDYLNEDQLRALRRVEEFGWELKFIRRPLFEQAVPVVVSHDGKQSGVLEADGSINMQHGLVIR